MDSNTIDNLINSNDHDSSVTMCRNNNRSLCSYARKDSTPSLLATDKIIV